MGWICMTHDVCLSSLHFQCLGTPRVQYVSAHTQHCSVVWDSPCPILSSFVFSRMLDLRAKTLPNYSCLLPLYPPQEVSPNLSYINSCLGVWFSEDPDRSTYLIPISSGTFGLVRLIPVTGREWIWEECDQMEEFWVQGRNQNTSFCGQT